jgi:hypothetical protein
MKLACILTVAAATACHPQRAPDERGYGHNICDADNGPHPPQSFDDVRRAFDVRDRGACKRSWTPRDEDPGHVGASCDELAREEATPAAAIACLRACEIDARAYNAARQYQLITQALQQAAAGIDKRGPSCKASGVADGTIRGRDARELWQCGGLVELPPSMAVEIRFARGDVDFLRVEGPLVPEGESFLFTYEDVSTGCGSGAHLVQVQPHVR